MGNYDAKACPIVNFADKKRIDKSKFEKKTHRKR